MIKDKMYFWRLIVASQPITWAFKSGVTDPILRGLWSSQDLSPTLYTTVTAKENWDPRQKPVKSFEWREKVIEKSLKQEE